MPNDPYLLLWLEAPLQSWGHDSKYGRRDSLDFPTKSGVLGLLCAARGVGDEQKEWLAQCVDLDMQCMSYVRSNAVTQESRRQPMLRDFHMVGAGYNDQDPWENLLIPKTSDGKKAVGGGTKMTYRYYLQDMAFAVALQIPAALAQETVNALQAPAWDLYLGRKSCVPTEFVYQGIFGDVAQALTKAEELAQSKCIQAYAHIRQGTFDGNAMIINDVPVCFGPQKQYRERRITVQRLT